MERVFISSLHCVMMADIQSNTTLAAGIFDTVSLIVRNGYWTLLAKEQLLCITFTPEIARHTSSMEFYVVDRYIQTERQGPFSCFGDKHGLLQPWVKINFYLMGLTTCSPIEPWHLYETTAQLVSNSLCRSKVRCPLDWDFPLRQLTLTNQRGRVKKGGWKWVVGFGRQPTGGDILQ